MCYTNKFTLRKLLSGKRRSS